MRAASMKERPSFPLMRQTDIQQIYHLQMPRWLFSDSRYADMTLEAKMVYTFLLNRFQLSRRNGWVNDYGEVFVIFPRKELVKELRVCEQRVTAAFHLLVERRLIWEKRCGRGDANQIYLACVQPEDDPEYASAPFLRPENTGARTAESAALTPEGSTADAQEAQNPGDKNRESCGSEAPEGAVQEPQDLRPSNIDKRNTESSYIEVSPSVGAAGAKETGQTDDGERELMDILDACELSFFDPATAKVFENAIERLFYSDSFRIGKATLPRSRVRIRLRQLDGLILREAESKLRAVLDKPVRNSTAYVMATIFNCIAESESDLMVDPYLNSLRSPPEGRG